MPSRQSCRAAGVEPYVSQGTFEKIQLERLLRQGSLEAADLFAQGRLTRVPGGRALATLRGLELIPPVIQQLSMHAQLLREGDDILTLLQPLYGVLPERLRKLAHASLGHLPPPLGVKCQFAVSQSRGSVQF
jgi:hypothetical protein